MTEIDTIPNEFFDIQIADNYTWSGEIIKQALYHYISWYLTRPLTECWNVFKFMYLENFKEKFTTQFKQYDPTKNYEYTETVIKTNSDGKITETRTPDNTNNFTETTTTYNNTTTTTAGTGANQPKTDTYSLAYDVEPKHTGYTTQSGETSVTNITNGDGDKIKTVDNLKYTKEKEHTEITKTIDGETYHGDYIGTESIRKSGYLNADIAKMINDKMNLFSVSLMNEFIEMFVNKYCFYVGGGICDD